MDLNQIPSFNQCFKCKLFMSNQPAAMATATDSKGNTQQIFYCELCLKSLNINIFEDIINKQIKTDGTKPRKEAEGM